MTSKSYNMTSLCCLAGHTSEPLTYVRQLRLVRRSLNEPFLVSFHPAARMLGHPIFHKTTGNPRCRHSELLVLDLPPSGLCKVTETALALNMVPQHSTHCFQYSIFKVCHDTVNINDQFALITLRKYSF